MSLQIIFPDESKMKPKKLDYIKDSLNKIFSKKIGKPEMETLNKCLGELQGYLLVADRKNLKEYYDYFYKLDFLTIFNNFLEKHIDRITFMILEMINFLTTNIQNKEILEYIYKQKFPSNIQGINMNIIDKLILLDTKKNEEYLTYQINFIKSLTLKINKDSLNYFYDCNINQFPILTKSLSLYNYTDPLIRNVVKNIFLAIIKIENPNLREFLTSFPINLYYANIIFQLKNSIIKICSIDLGENETNKAFGKLQKEHDFIIDTVFYIADLISLNIEKINFILINCMLKEIIFPLIYTLINKNQQNVTIYHSLYMLCLILFTIKNEFLYKVITTYLFTEKISNNIFSKMPAIPFQNINKNFMDNINFLITNYQYADVNDHFWQTIKTYMKSTNGIDLSTGEIDIENIYDTLKNLMINMNSQNDLYDNIIFKTINDYLSCNDDAIILILNLIVYSLAKSYKNLQYEDTDKENENKIEMDDDDNDFNLISENKEEKKISKDGLKTTLLINDFFKMELNDNKSKNIINYLFNYLSINKVFRIATYETILINIQSLINIFLEKNNNSDEAKKAVLIKLVNLIDEQYNKMNSLLKGDNNLSKYLFDSCEKAYDHYIKNQEKKINDLITLPNILIPIIYIDKMQEIPEYLKEDKFSNEILKNYIFNIFFIYDIINDILGKQKEKIKSQKFPLAIDSKKYSMGKEYKEEDLGEDYVHCRILRNNSLTISQAILTSDSLYFGEVMSGNFADLSRVKIFKKIFFRYLEIQKGDDECSLNLIDKTTKISRKTPIKMNCLTSENTKSMFNWLLQQMQFCQNLEESLFSSFMDEMKKKVHDYLFIN
jgi:hypothetical protein